MEIKAIFFDIDGTLVPFGDHRPPQEVIEAITALRARGIKVFVATGRHAVWIDNLDGIEFDGFVTANGSMCVESDRTTVTYSHPIAHEDVERLMNAKADLDLEFCLVAEDGENILTGINKNVKDVCSLINIPPIPVRPIESICHKPIVQMMAFGEPEKWSSPLLYSDVLKSCSPTSWNPYFCDIIPKGSSKSKGIAKMLEIHGISRDNTMAFGDGDNDITMLEYCNVGVGMGNGSETVKAAADYITDDCRDHGIINALTHFGIL